MKQLWGSRFSKTLNKATNDFNSSLSFDKRLCVFDIKGSLAHSQMLFECGILVKEEWEKIKDALIEILLQAQNNEIEFDFELEDIHTQIEKLLVEKIGETGKKVHTARSRNDQVALDVRMFAKDEIQNIKKLLIELIKTLIKISEEHTDTIMSGYTHLQRAQVITFAHHLSAYTEMFKRDFERLKDTFKRVNILPLGACALAGTPHNINRYKTAELLGFDDICQNSLDAVSDRDFIIEFLSNLSIIMVHLSRFSEELILWSSYEFKFIELDDSYATGSSIMPQKKNPDIPELIRGKTGRVFGHLIGILTTMKSLPLAYNKDMQEDKEGLFDAIDTVKACLEILPDMLLTMKVNKDKMLQSVKEGFLNATEVADYLVKKGVAFRTAHEISGKLVSFCIKQGKTLDEILLADYRRESELFEEDIFDFIDAKNSVNSRNSEGAPSKKEVLRVIKLNKDWIKNNEEN